MPYIELYEMEVGGKRHHLWSAGLQMAACGAVAVFGALILIPAFFLI
ncbi:MAG: hypothetical protein ACUVV6_00695 [Thermoplasmatota archaeon]